MTELRIYGPVLGESETFIDVTVDKQNSAILERSITLAEKNGTRTWTMDIERLETLQDRRVAITHSQMTHPKHNVWDRLDGLRGDIQSDPFNADDDLLGDVEQLFQIVVERMTPADSA